MSTSLGGISLLWASWPLGLQVVSTITSSDHLYFDLISSAADVFTTLSKLSVVCVATVIVIGLAEETSREACQDEVTR